MRLAQITFFVFVLSAVLIGQTNRGGISGTVTDSNGAVVPSAKVTITNVGRNQSTTVTTSAEGVFSVSSLDPAEYSVLAEAKNFKKAIVQKVKVDTATVLTVNIVLDAGNFAETVTIEAEDALINAESGTTGRTISEMQLRELPLNNRSVLDLAVTVPNVTGDAGSEDPEVTSGQPVPGFNLNVNGGRSGSTSILADGVNNTGVGIARAVVSFTPETVQEFKVQSSAYSAEYGQTGGGVINVTTKSGSNRLNGTALFYHRNPATNSRPYRIGTTPRTPNNLKYSQASFTVGGPIYLPRFGEGTPPFYDGHSKSFFFFAYEPRWRQDFVTTTTLFPTAAEKSGDFRNLVRTGGGWLPASVVAQFGSQANLTSVGPSAIYQQYTLANGRLTPIVLGTGQWFCQFGATAAQGMTSNALGQPICPVNNPIFDSLNVIPQAFIDPIAAKLIRFQPEGTGYFVDNGVVRNAVLDRQVTQNETRYTLRLDHQLTNSNKLNFRITKTPAIGVRNFGSDVNGSTGVFSDAKQILIGDDHIFSSSIVNSLKLNYTRGVFSEDFAPEFSINGGRNLATELGLPSVTRGGLPLFQISGDGGYNAFADVGSSGSTNNFNVEERFNINDVVYWSQGNKAWKFGVDLSHARLNVIPFFGASGGRWEFRTLNTDRSRANSAAAGGNNLASLLIGVPNAVQVRPLLVNYDYRWDAGALFVQNDWKLRPNLTINLGLRYSLQLPRTEKNNLQGVFRLDKIQTVTLTDAQRRAMASGTGGLGIPATDPIPSYVPTVARIPAFAFAGVGGNSRYLVPVDKTDFEPRFGFAWSPKFWKWAEKRNTVLRGGYGIAHAAITGNNRSPNPDFFSFQAASTGTAGSTAGFTADPTQPVSLSYNPPLGITGNLKTRLNISPEGLNFANSIAMGGFVYPGDSAGKIPYSQSWNLSLSFQVMKNTVVEVAYVGNKGTHLYMPRVNVNPRDPNFVDQLEVNNLSAEGTLVDPLARVSLVGAAVNITRASIVSPFLGFGNLERYLDPSANSIRHAGYIEVQRRFSRGLQFTANYTYGKSIDDASDASPDVRVLTTGTTLGQVYYGAPRSGDRSVSIFDIKKNFSSTFVWELPFGKKGALFANAPKLVNGIIGGWSVSGVLRYQGGQVFTPFITDTNRLGGVNRSVRLNIVPGVPLKNPLYSKGCTIGAGCEPYINPAAFMRPPKGTLGNSSRTLDVRAPTQRYFDATIQKSFVLPFIGGEGKRKINFRVDLINAFNHPTFRYNNTGNTPFGFGGLPNEALLTAADITAWNTANPGQTADINQVNALINNSRLPVAVGQTLGALPLDFFSVRIPQGFATTAATIFDIRTLAGLKLYRARQAYDTNFGTLFSNNNPRYIQFGIRLFF